MCVKVCASKLVLCATECVCMYICICEFMLLCVCMCVCLSVCLSVYVAKASSCEMFGIWTHSLLLPSSTFMTFNLFLSTYKEGHTECVLALIQHLIAMPLYLVFYLDSVKQ